MYLMISSDCLNSGLQLGQNPTFCPLSCSLDIHPPFVF